VVSALEVPFEPSQIEWRVMNTTKNGQPMRGQVVPYADQRAYTDRLNALFIFDEAQRTRAEREGPDLLGALTRITGGRTIAIRNLKKIKDAAEKLSVELRNQYLIAYRPSDLTHDGKWHKINLRVTPPKNDSHLRVYAKRGYYAPPE
jgi:Ca-activated chloride channel homolog